MQTAVKEFGVVGFGGHPVGPHEAEQRERREGRVGDFYRPDRDGAAA